MYRSSSILPRWFATILCISALGGLASAQISVRSVKVLGAKDAVEIEVEASDRVVPQTRVLSDPDRLVIDFPNSLPGALLRSQSVDRGDVKAIRVGLFQSKPPITRVVLDLKRAQSYQIFPYGRTVMIKVTGSGSAVATGAASVTPLVSASYTVARVEPTIVPAPPPEPALEVTYRDGLLGIQANKATLSDVLSAIQQRTGAEVTSAPGVEQEIVVVQIAPAPAPDVLARLLNGSKFNFLILSAPNDPRKLDRVILTARTEGYTPPLPMPESEPIVQDTAPIPEVPNMVMAPVQPPPVQPPPAGPSNPQPNPPEQNAPNE